MSNLYRVKILNKGGRYHGQVLHVRREAARTLGRRGWGLLVRADEPTAALAANLKQAAVRPEISGASLEK